MNIETKQFDFSNRVYVIIAVLVIVIAVSYIASVVLDILNLPAFQPGEITITGEGKVYAIPDLATVDLSMVDEGMDISLITKKNTEKMNALIADIKALGIDEKDIKTTQYSLVPQYNWTEKEGQIFIGYKLTNTILVTIRDFAKIGDVLGKANKRGTNQIGDISFSVEDSEKVKQEARDKAISQAKEKAEKLAKATGFRLGKVVNVQESYSPYYPIRKPQQKFEEEAAVTPDIQAGQQEITSNVNITYLIY